MTKPDPIDKRILTALALGFPLTSRQIAKCLTTDLAWTRKIISRLHESRDIRITGTEKTKGKPENIYSLTRKGSGNIEG